MYRLNVHPRVRDLHLLSSILLIFLYFFRYFFKESSMSSTGLLDNKCKHIVAIPKCTCLISTPLYNQHE
ncbi:hypothetical protein K443DRAFT_271023 [Laccaria amethystina LaAM-08-1]|uniref:Uncharacterized protein n=1 Tax=Laccaria amethystina LaAM-08-1 TaxID=1095629 RepID=A0A0C9WL23_9AGAR|nr:hypothetical protein K443DRAFT_271023 [Laccaria amethystina LaAM-08-1]